MHIFHSFCRNHLPSLDYCTNVFNSNELHMTDSKYLVYILQYHTGITCIYKLKQPGYREKYLLTCKMDYYCFSVVILYRCRNSLRGPRARTRFS